MSKIKYIKFYSDTCEPCKRFDIELEKLWIKDTNIESINIKTENVEKYKVRSVPFAIKYIDGVEDSRFWGGYLIENIIKDNVTKEELQEIHKNLRKYRYFYYECSNIISVDKNTISDYEYDMLEKKYDKICNAYDAPRERRVTNFIGFSNGIPKQLFENFPQNK